jgi:hypothetical protein
VSEQHLLEYAIGLLLLILSSACSFDRIRFGSQIIFIVCRQGFLRRVVVSQNMRRIGILYEWALSLRFGIVK